MPAPCAPWRPVALFPALQQVIAKILVEAELYADHGDCCGYAFFVLRAPGANSRA